MIQLCMIELVALSMGSNVERDLAVVCDPTSLSLSVLTCYRTLDK